MRSETHIGEVLDQLTSDGWPEVEVYHKVGRSRILRIAPGSQTTSLQEEEGWAVRAGDRRRSFFYAASGPPKPGALWPEADGQGLRLPSARLVPRWTAPADLEAPLVGENEARALLEGLGRALDTELPGGRITTAILEDGSSESLLLSSREIDAKIRRRAASLYVESLAPGTRPVNLSLVTREARGLNPLAIARRLADRLLIARKGESPLRDRGEFLLAPTVVIRLLSSLGELWVGPEAHHKTSSVIHRNGKVGCTGFTLIDNGRLPGGLFEAPVDGEGQPCREVRLVEEGLFRQPLLTWWQETTGRGRASGCCQRASWRDLPLPGVTHLHVKPDPAIGVAALLGDIQRGYYLLDCEGAPRVDVAGNRFAMPVCGFAIEAGQATSSVSRAWLGGSLSSFFGGVLGVGRDLTFLPALGGMVGSPSLRVRGLELRQAP